MLGERRHGQSYSSSIVGPFYWLRDRNYGRSLSNQVGGRVVHSAAQLSQRDGPVILGSIFPSQGYLVHFVPYA